MADIRGKVNTLYSLEQLAAGDTVIHRVRPLPKLLVTLVYLVCVLSLDRRAPARLSPFLFYPATVMALAVLTAGGLSLLASGDPDGLEWSIERAATVEIAESERDGIAYNSVSGLAGAAVTCVLAGGVGLAITFIKRRANLVSPPQAGKQDSNHEM